MKKYLTLKQAGKKGGKTTLKKYGKIHFSKLGKRSAKMKKTRTLKVIPK